MAVNLTNWLYFYFIRISVKGLGISKIVDLAISKAILIEIDIAVDISGLFL